MRRVDEDGAAWHAAARPSRGLSGGRVRKPVRVPATIASREHLEALADEYDRPVMLAHGDDHFLFMDQPLANRLFSRVQTYGESQVHWLKVHVRLADLLATGAQTI